MSREALSSIDYTDRDYLGYKESMIENLKEKIPEYTDTSDTDAGIVIIDSLAKGLDSLSFYNDAIANDLFLATTQDRRLAVLMAKDLGYVPYDRTASVVKQVFVLGSVKPYDFIIGKGTVVRTEYSNDSIAVYFETDGDLVIPQGALGNETDENGDFLYTVNVIQGASVKEDYFGSSNGTPYQSFKLGFQSVIIDSLEVYIDEGSGPLLWEQVDSFLGSSITADSKVYTVSSDEYDNYFVEFGNGIRGKIPTTFENGMYANYRIGGGLIGNVQANTINVVDTGIAYIDSTFNPSTPVILGHEKETIDEIRYNGPASLRIKERAVTLQDYEDLLIVSNSGDFYSIQTAQALQDSVIKTQANIYYFMREGYSMTQELLDTLHSYFSSVSMIGTSTTFIEHLETGVDLVSSLIVMDGYYRSSVEDLVRDFIENTYFSYGSFLFKEELSLTDLENEVKSSVSGVKSFRISSPITDIVTPEDGSIIVLSSLNITSSGGKV